MVDPRLHINGYLGHPEKLLLSMLADFKKYIRELSFRKILKCKQSPHNDNQVRKFSTLYFNFNADDYFEVIN